MTPFKLACIVCGYPVSWHRDADNRTITCCELMMAHGPKTQGGIRDYLIASADKKRLRGLKRLKNATSTAKSSRRTKNTKK